MREKEGCVTDESSIHSFDIELRHREGLSFPLALKPLMITNFIQRTPKRGFMICTHYRNMLELIDMIYRLINQSHIARTLTLCLVQNKSYFRFKQYLFKRRHAIPEMAYSFDSRWAIGPHDISGVYSTVNLCWLDEVFDIAHGGTIFVAVPVNINGSRWGFFVHHDNIWPTHPHDITLSLKLIHSVLEVYFYILWQRVPDRTQEYGVFMLP